MRPDLKLEKIMKRFYIFLLTFFQMCTPAKIVGVPAPGPNNYWIQFLIQKEIEEIIGNDNLSELSTPQDSDKLTLKHTLLLGAPNADTSGKSLIVDEKGFIYITGDTNGSVYRAANSIGIRDLIFGKYDSQMNLIWTYQIGNARVRLKVEDIAVDSNENTYIIGSTKELFRGAKQEGEDDLFLIKFDSNGNELWSLQNGIPNHSILPSKIALDPSGNIYITGKSTGPFGGPLSGSNGFIAKFDDKGNKNWVKQIAIPNTRSFPEGLVINKTTSDIYITGSGNADYKKDTASGTGIDDLFILKYDNNGNRQFFAQLGSLGKSFHSKSVTVDLSGNVIVSGTSNGRFNDQLTGTSWLGTIVKYDSFGNLQWVQQFGPDSAPPEQAVILSIITDIHGNIFTTGHTNGNILNGTDNSSGVQDAFITKHNSSGQIKWMQQIGIPNATIFGNGLGLDSKGNLYVIGNTNRGINETPIIGANDMFLIKYE
ncbi:hypothetical protein KHM19_11090 [Leptospira borgpetersenii]|nr:hypothetical protein KHM19_11090 [Leptospira borgpetersenii]GIM25402.1 hypothetical protein KHM25_13270 [Leptospira borgpetersenii]